MDYKKLHKIVDSLENTTFEYYELTLESKSVGAYEIYRNFFHIEDTREWCEANVNLFSPKHWASHPEVAKGEFKWLTPEEAKGYEGVKNLAISCPSFYYVYSDAEGKQWAVVVGWVRKSRKEFIGKP